jgi:hypothetical protein
LLKGSRAFYRGPKGIEKVTVVGVHHDAKLEPYYTIKFRDGKEKQMDGKCLTPIEEKSGTPVVVGKEKRESCVDVPTTDQCSSSSSEGHDDDEEEEEEDRFHKGQDAYYRSPSGEGVTKIKILERSNHQGEQRYSVVFPDGTTKLVEGDNLAGLIDLTSKELASLMKEKNERHAAPMRGCTSTSNLRSSMQSRDSHEDGGYEPEAEPSSSENSYEDKSLLESPEGVLGGKKVLALPCAVQMVEARTEEGETKLVPLYKAEMDVYYRGPQGITTAHIVKTHFDDLLEPYYTIRLEDGREKQTDNAHISLEKPEEPEEEEEGCAAKDDTEEDDWYQEWKANQLKQDQAMRDEIKEYEEQNALSVEESREETTRASSPQESTVAKEEHSEHTTQEEESEPDLAMGALVPKTLGRRGSAVAETPQVKKQDPDDSSTALIQAPQFHVGDSVLYNSSRGDHMRATITKVRKDDKHRPYFVVKLSNGDEKKVYGHRLTPVRREDRSQRDSGRTRSRSRSSTREPQRERSRSVTRRDRDRESNKTSLSKRSTFMDPRRLSRMASMESNGSRDASIDRSRSSMDRRQKMDRSRSMSRPPKEYQSRGRRAESRDPRGRVHPVETKEMRSRSKSVRALPKDNGNKEGGIEHRQRARSRSRAPEESVRRSTASRKAPMVMGVSHRVQHIGEDEGSTARSKGSTSRFGKLKSSISSGISKAKQRSFEIK